MWSQESLTNAAVAASVLVALLLNGCAAVPSHSDRESGVVELRYSVTMNAQDPLRLQASIDLTPVLGRAERALLRAKQLGLAQQVESPKCDDRVLPFARDAGWDLPTDCRVLT